MRELLQHTMVHEAAQPHQEEVERGPAALHTARIRTGAVARLCWVTALRSGGWLVWQLATRRRISTIHHPRGTA